MVRSSLLLLLAATALVASTSADAAKPKRPVAKAPPADPAPIDTAPVFTRTADGMMTPLAVRLRPTTPAEAEANAVWNIRAALNVAALGCQYSPFLATVRNYNDALRHHAEEFDRARLMMTAHFKRYDGTRAQNSFDRYVTQTYNSYSTLDAQYAFCDAAASLGRTVLTIRKGQLGASAATMRDTARAALTPVAARALLVPVEIVPGILPQL